MPALRALSATSELVAVVCQPDRPAGRGLELQSPAVKRAALEMGVVVHQPVKVKTGTLHEWLAALAVDVAVVMAYGRILPDAVLAAPRRGCMNLHASLLPKYRGAAPINWCLIEGEDETGISLMQMDAGMDTGPVYARRAIAISPDANAGTLAAELAELAAVVVREDLPRAVRGDLVATPQDAAQATYAPLIERAHTLVDWNQPPDRIVNLVRGMAPRPAAQTTLRGKWLKLHALRPAASFGGAPGEVRVLPDRRVLIACAAGAVELVLAQPEGRKVQSGQDLVNGRTLVAGEVLGR